MKRAFFRTPQYAIHYLYCVLFFFLTSCSSIVVATPFIAPRSQKSNPTSLPASASDTAQPSVALSPAPLPTINPDLQQSATPELPTAIPGAPLPFPTISPSETLFPVPTSFPAETTTPVQNCTDSLKYIQDINYPDGTVVSGGQSIDKQWLVENNGTCNWEGNYSLKLLNGYTSMGAAGEMILRPAQAGSQLTITINFTAPSLPGPYRTAWQAYNPDGIAFGDAIYMEVNVGQ